MKKTPDHLQAFKSGAVIEYYRLYEAELSRFLEREKMSVSAPNLDLAFAPIHVQIERTIYEIRDN